MAQQKTIDEVGTKTKKFQTVARGESFRPVGGNLCIRVDNIVDGGNFNALEVEGSGNYLNLDDDDNVVTYKKMFITVEI